MNTTLDAVGEATKSLVHTLAMAHRHWLIQRNATNPEQDGFPERIALHVTLRAMYRVFELKSPGVMDSQMDVDIINAFADAIKLETVFLHDIKADLGGGATA